MREQVLKNMLRFGEQTIWSGEDMEKLRFGEQTIWSGEDMEKEGKEEETIKPARDPKLKKIDQLHRVYDRLETCTSFYNYEDFNFDATWALHKQALGYLKELKAMK